MLNTNNQAGRQFYERSMDMFYRAFLESYIKDGQPNPAGRCQQYVDTLKFTPHEIRLEVNLNATSTNFRFAMLQTQANSSNIVFPTENRLTLQDTMCVGEYGIFIAQPSGNNDNTFQPRTYPNTQDWATAADVVALNGALYGNSYLRLTCNNDVLIPYRGLFNHLYRPQTQETNALGAGSPQDQIRGAEDGMVAMEPNIMLIGSKDYKVDVILQTALASAVEQTRLIIIFRGILAQNSTSVS